ncbi:3' terminal RNA ribose 2'-O-methyltransferase Hen1 [Phormidesmis sp. 146-33]
MLLTITTTHSPATDLGYLLGKHPDRFQSFDLSFGRAQVFYPEATPDRCTVVLLLEIDPVKLVRGQATTLDQYVNDRPYVASSFMSVAIAQVFRSALSGQCKDRPDLTSQPIPLWVKLSVLPCRGGQEFLHRLFEPLGYVVTTTQLALDEHFPEWGNSFYYSVELVTTTTLQTLLSHLYVLVPVLDEDKHYWVGEEEVEKLLRHGESWLSSHPEKVQITQRYLKRQKHLAQAALAQLSSEELPEPISSYQAEASEKPISLNQIRYETVIDSLKQFHAKRVIDLGCGEGKLVAQLAKDVFFEQITGLDVSSRSLEIAQEKLDRLLISESQKQRIQLFQGALTYRDRRLENYDAATLVEVIEHLDESRLAALERVVFEFAHPRIVLVTTPNREYNVKFITLATGTLRHHDHRFEWTRQEFQTWATTVSQRFGYTVSFADIGALDLVVGAPTQLAIFERSSP